MKKEEEDVMTKRFAINTGTFSTERFPEGTRDC
jgi:hypothetical protein